eukprot:EG_transcript_3061
MTEPDGDAAPQAELDDLLRAFKAALKAVLRHQEYWAGAAVSFADPDPALLVQAIQRALSHGLLPDTSLWDCVEHLEHRTRSESIQRVKQHAARQRLGAEERAAVWLQLSLATGTLPEALTSLAAQADVQQAYYRPGAFLRSEHHSTVLAMSLTQLGQLTFEPPLPRAAAKSDGTNGPLLTRGLSSLRDFALEKAAQTQKEFNDWAAKVEHERTEVHALKRTLSSTAREAQERVADLTARLELSEAVRRDVSQQLAAQVQQWGRLGPRMAELGLDGNALAPGPAVLALLLDEERDRLRLSLAALLRRAAVDQAQAAEQRAALQGQVAAAQRTVLLLQQGVAEAEDVAATACRHMNAALLQLAEQEERAALAAECAAAAQRLAAEGPPGAGPPQAVVEEGGDGAAAEPVHCPGCAGSGMECSGLAWGREAQALRARAVRLQEQLERAKEEIVARNEVLQQMIAAAENGPDALEAEDAAARRDTAARLQDLVDRATAQTRRDQARIQQLEREVQMERDVNKVNYGSMTAALEKAKAQAKHQAALAAEERQRAESSTRRLEDLQAGAAERERELAQHLEAERHTAAQLARRVRTLEAELQGVSTNAGVVQTELESAKARLRFQERELAAAQEQLKESRTQLAAQQAAQVALEEQLREARTQLEDAHQDGETERSLVEGRLKELEQQREALVATVEQRNTEIVQLTNRLDALQDELDALRDDPKERRCQLCAADFHLTRRRHHCRACSRAVCDACAPLRVQANVAQFGGKPTRVCKNCS